MNYLFAAIFGLIEGITEWLPVSSTGHLIIAEDFMKFTDLADPAGFWSLFEVVIQLGAILAVVVLFFKKLWPLKYKTDESEKLDDSEGKRFAKKHLGFDMDILKLWGKIIVACLPAILIVLLKIDEKAEALYYNPTCVAIALIVVGIAFIVVEILNKKRKKEPRVNSINELKWSDAIIIGIFQIIAAIFPGASRSGVTIIGALLIGVSRSISAEFTFYLAIPAMAGASLLKILKYGGSLGSQELVLLAIASIVAFVVSIFVIKFLMNYIKKHDFKVFGVYRILIGIVVLVLGLTGVISVAL